MILVPALKDTDIKKESNDFFWLSLNCYRKEGNIVEENNILQQNRTRSFPKNYKAISPGDCKIETTQSKGRKLSSRARNLKDIKTSVIFHNRLHEFQFISFRVKSFISNNINSKKKENFETMIVHEGKSSLSSQRETKRFFFFNSIQFKD